jgi:hypothetical protein
VRIGAQVLLAAALMPAAAEAQLARRRFDPEDLKLEEPGVLHADLQLGIIRGPTAGRWVLPDFGLDLGVAPNVELGIDGAFALEGTEQRLYALDHASPDNIWLSSKIGVASWQSATTGATWATGFQLGPKIAAAQDARGAGFEGLVLVGRSRGRTHVVLNVGGFVDPGAEISRGRPAAMESGIDVEAPLDDAGTWTMLADLSAVYFLSGQPHQLQTTFGPQWSAGDALDLSVQALFGILSHNDHYGALLVVSPRW